MRLLVSLHALRQRETDTETLDFPHNAALEMHLAGDVLNKTAQVLLPCQLASPLVEASGFLLLRPPSSSSPVEEACTRSRTELLKSRNSPEGGRGRGEAAEGGGGKGRGSNSPASGGCATRYRTARRGPWRVRWGASCQLRCARSRAGERSEISGGLGKRPEANPRGRLYLSGQPCLVAQVRAWVANRQTERGVAASAPNAERVVPIVIHTQILYARALK